MYYIHVLYIHVQLIFLGKVTALGVLCCFALFVCLTLLASFFLPSHLSFKNMYMYMHVLMRDEKEGRSKQGQTNIKAKHVHVINPRKIRKSVGNVLLFTHPKYRVDFCICPH